MFLLLGSALFHCPHVTSPSSSSFLQLAGWLRMFFIYIISGIGGYLMSANFTPYQVCPVCLPPPARFSPRGLEASSINTCLPFDSRQSDGAPYIAPKVSTGASPALYGLLGCLFVELFQSWRLLESPWKELIKLTLISIVALAVGLLPYIDNWSHSTLARGSCKGHGALMLSSCSQSQRSTHLEECSLPCLVVTILT